ncbi:MAG: hypothetical protein HY813_02380 [Candidatus Portnoybacteria bacterium]|nr:hypothetical protein [Candidatus Portnoybacteria bacterium]
MRNKNIIILVIIVILGVGIAAGLILILKRGDSGAVNTSGGVSPGSTATSVMDQPESNNVVANDNFSFRYPTGWRSVPPPQGVSAMVVAQDEKITDPQALKMNFKSYIAVTYDTSNEDLNQYADTVKAQLRTTFPEASFLNEKAILINGRDAYAMEALLNKSGADFQVLMVMVRGEGDDVWILSFNTLKSLWGAYAGVFGDAANAFVVKKPL